MQSQFDQSEILTYDVEEGTLTVSENALYIPTGERITTGTFADQVLPENFLKLGVGENALALAKTATNVATHFNLLDPQVDGQLPDETTTQSNLPSLRFVGAVLLKPGEFLLPVIDANVIIAPGDKLTVQAGGQGLDKATAATTQVAIAMESKAANEGGYIRCLLDGPIVVEA